MSIRLRRTKIVTTLAPPPIAITILKKIIRAGANVVRMNFSHGSPTITLNVRIKSVEIAARLGVQVAIRVISGGRKSEKSTF